MVRTKESKRVTTLAKQEKVVPPKDSWSHNPYQPFAASEANTGGLLKPPLDLGRCLLDEPGVPPHRCTFRTLQKLKCKGHPFWGLGPPPTVSTPGAPAWLPPPKSSSLIGKNQWELEHRLWKKRMHDRANWWAAKYGETYAESVSQGRPEAFLFNVPNPKGKRSGQQPLQSKGEVEGRLCPTVDPLVSCAAGRFGLAHTPPTRGAPHCGQLEGRFGRANPPD